MTAPLASSLWVIIPAYNESARIAGTIKALREQTDRGFSIVVVNNGSTDDTADVVRRCAGNLSVEVIDEPTAGPGSAVDAGMRHAISRGATILARTDADCLPLPDWIACLRARFAAGAQVVCGASLPRPDEHPGVFERAVVPAVHRGLARIGAQLPANRGREYRGPFVLCHGHNMALTAEIYLACGGSPHARLVDAADDVVLLNRARRQTSAVVRAEEVRVMASNRRLHTWGIRRTLLWHWDRRYRPASASEVHIR